MLLQPGHRLYRFFFLFTSDRAEERTCCDLMLFEALFYPYSLCKTRLKIYFYIIYHRHRNVNKLDSETNQSAKENTQYGINTNDEISFVFMQKDMNETLCLRITHYT